jgi:hypothetical protein
LFAADLMGNHRRMFIQVIQGKVKDEAGLQRCMERWERELEPGAAGYLGTTAGICDDGTFIALARFESAKAATRNSERPEQSAWWAEMAACFDGEVSFMDCSDARPWLGGGSDDAGFVQIMEGRSPNVRRMHEIMDQAGDQIQRMRPEIIGAMIADTSDGRYVDAVYFTSEAEARQHEAMDIPDDMRTLFDEQARLMGEVAYFDLHHPMLVSPRG